MGKFYFLRETAAQGASPMFNTEGFFWLLLLPMSLFLLNLIKELTLLLEGRGAHRRAPVFFQVGKFLPQKGCLWVYLFHLRLLTRTQALDAAVDISVIIIKVSGLAGARASFPGESKDCDDCLEAKWSQQSEQQTPESNNNSERLR